MSFSTLLATVDGFVLEHLGETVTYTSEAGAEVEVQGVFDAVYTPIEAGQAGVSSCGPAVFLRLADLPTDPSTESPTVTIGSVEYEVREAKPDGKGGVILLLHRV